jgi:predicted MPP superfamily phosphohydrolase
MYTYAWRYLIAVSLLAMFLTVHDKRAAKKDKWRVKERTLLLVAVIGGSAAELLTMLTIRHKTRKAKFMAGLPIILAAQIVFIAFAFNTSIAVSHHTVQTDKIDGQIKFALVTDFHSCDYRDGQSELMNAIANENPDVVLLAGDIFDDVLPVDNAAELVARVSDKYPCYYVSGNHEFWSGKADEFKNIIASYGVKVLEGGSDILTVGANSVLICGVDDPDTDRYPSRADSYAKQIESLSAEANNALFKILLSHRPERTGDFTAIDPDLILSGHAHGGQWRIPYILENGLLSPDQGLFPKYTNGGYFLNGAELIVSRGLARESTRAPRIFNRPEIVVITTTNH